MIESKARGDKPTSFDWLKRFALVVVAIWIVVTIFTLSVGVSLWGL